MTVLKRVFDFYIQSSIHVALSCYSLVRMTHHMLHLPDDSYMAFFAFFGTISGYNFVKYDALARTGSATVSFKIKSIAFLSFVSLLAAVFCFFNLGRNAQIASFLFLALTILYTLPFFPNRGNARNWAGVKIYIVSLCWVGVTVVLPVLNSDSGLYYLTDSDFFLKMVQRFVLIFTLVLVFEILDLAKDDPHLHTVPQQIGVKKTKVLGLLLLAFFYFLEFFKNSFDPKQIVVNSIIVVLIAVFLTFANEKKSKYYTSFWVEGIPIFWWVLVVFFG